MNSTAGTEDGAGYIRGFLKDSSSILAKLNACRGYCAESGIVLIVDGIVKV